LDVKYYFGALVLWQILAFEQRVIPVCDDKDDDDDDNYISNPPTLWHWGVAYLEI